MPKGEFENRDRDEASELSGIPLAGGLGEIPESLANERGDLDSYATRAAENMAPDMARAQVGRVDAAETGLGSPKIDYGVRSIYDSRPINHREFNLWFEREIDEGGDANDMEFARNCFVVPQGYVAILRRCAVIVPPPATLTNYDGTMNILVNGSIIDPPQVIAGQEVDEVEPAQRAIPWRSNVAVDTFVFADEGSTVGLELVLVSGTTLETDELQIGFYGQLLLKTGVPAQFQAANEAGRARTADTSSRSDLAISDSSGVTIKRRKRNPFPGVPLLKG
jgi:hypothetical protein